MSSLCDLTHGLWHVLWFVATSSAFLHVSLLRSLISFFATLHLFDLGSERSLTEPNH